jgi:hypothetical protein
MSIYLNRSTAFESQSLKSLTNDPEVSVPGIAANTSASQPPALYFLIYFAEGFPKTATITSS